jgi:hypothetical protein
MEIERSLSVSHDTGQWDRRFLVPDLSPQGHPEQGDFAPRVIFVAESPHVSEVEPERLADRRPLCGIAGRQWWSLLSELLEGHSNADVSLRRLLEICVGNGIAVMNAVQYPLDPKVAVRFPEAAPERVLGFSKLPGKGGYKALKSEPQVRAVVEALRLRLNHPSLGGVPIYCLGGDAQWFLLQALGAEEYRARVACKIPHPSAWWRRGGHFGRVAREQLRGIFRPS